MTLHVGTTTFECTDAARAAHFWAQALGHAVDDGASQHFASIGRTRVGRSYQFVRVDEPKVAKNRLRVDLRCGDREAEVARLVGIGAEHLGEFEVHGVRWTAMRDVEGNEFCVAAQARTAAEPDPSQPAAVTEAAGEAIVQIAALASADPACEHPVA